MVIEYGCRNAWCFKEWMQVKFSINKNVPSEYGFIDARVVPILCFEGANASGKSSALRVLSFIQDFACNSFQYPVEKGIVYNSFFNNLEPSDFYIDFCFNDKLDEVYHYEMQIDMNHVISEILVKKAKGTKENILKRLNNKITIDRISNKKGILLRPNASIISTYMQYGVKEIEKYITFFRHFISNVSFQNTQSEPDYVPATQYYFDNQGLHSKAMLDIKRMDTGIEKFDISYRIDENNKKRYSVMFGHEVESGVKQLPLQMQSTGTLVLYSKLPQVYFTLENGGVMVFDELDCHLHPDLAYEVIKFFTDYSINTNHAQLVFTSHDSSNLDTAKKYRSYLFNKECGESYCYRIDELSNSPILRNERPLSNVYKSGLLGGKPNVKERKQQEER